MKKKRKAKTTVKLPPEVKPCYACPERGIERRFGVCNHGAGICEACMGYWERRGERWREGLNAQ